MWGVAKIEENNFKTVRGLQSQMHLATTSNIYIISMKLLAEMMIQSQEIRANYTFSTER